MSILSDLADKYGTDKQKIWHNYVVMYEKLLKTIDVDSLLEIGLGAGSSIKMWMEYFPEAKISCIESFGDENKINWKSTKGDIKNLNLIKGDSSNRKTWKDVPYDLSVIIDDGDHHPDMQIKTFVNGFRHLKSGGLYFIEDIQGSFQPSFCVDNHCMIFDWLYDLMLNQQKTGYSFGGNFYMARKRMNDIVKDIYSYHIYKAVIVFEKA